MDIPHDQTVQKQYAGKSPYSSDDEFCEGGASFSGSKLKKQSSSDTEMKEKGVLVGIFGCSHGDTDILRGVIKEMKDRNVTKVIANGDFVSAFDSGSLEQSLRCIHGLFLDRYDFYRNKGNVYIMPGNWDHCCSGISPLEANNIMERFGQLIVSEYDSCGRITVNGKTIQVAHYPQHSLPRKYLPPDQFLYRFISRQAHLFKTMSNQNDDLSSVDLNVVGHTHIHTHFYDTTSRTLTYSPGGLTNRKKNEEKKGFGIYDTDTGVVTTFSVEKRGVGSLVIEKIGEYFDHVKMGDEGLYEVYNIKDPKICGLEFDEVCSVACKYSSFDFKWLDLLRP